jgi:F0F1-type ATP synthase gamma subunit
MHKATDNARIKKSIEINVQQSTSRFNEILEIVGGAEALNG